MNMHRAFRLAFELLGVFKSGNRFWHAISEISHILFNDLINSENSLTQRLRMVGSGAADHVIVDVIRI